MDGAKRVVLNLLEGIDVHIGGDRSWDIAVTNEGFYRRVLAGGSLALGESYMDGWWSCRAIDELIFRILSGDLETRVRRDPRVVLSALSAALTNRQRRSHAFTIAERHYDLGNDLFAVMLDHGMNYSCAYWKGAATLDEAQERKLELICRKIALERGMRVLDIGCGWGGFARYAAERYAAQVVGITVSKEQVRLGRERCAGLPVEIRLQDYRDLEGRFDRIVSIGMVEHVGYKNYRRFMEIARRCLERDGIFLLHTIGANTLQRAGEPWTERYIFPNGILPSASSLARASEGLFRLEDWQNFGAYYDSTLLAWHRNFTAGWDGLKGRYGERFFRMWSYYLLSSAGGFRARRNQLWQIVLSPLESDRVYEGVRL